MSEFTVGVEEEYQLVDPATGALRSSGRAVLDVDWSGEIRRELQESTIEIGTCVCRTASSADAELRRLRLQAAAAAAAEDLEIVAAGVHPFSGWRGHQRSEGPRYEHIAQKYGRLARDEHIFGMHVHVAVPDRLERIPLLNVVRHFVPHLIALSCSSPYFEGEDSGFASYRMVLWRRWPGAGLPPRLCSDAEYRRYIDAQLKAGVLEDERSVYWMIRLHPVYPTLEFRMFDVCPRVEDASAIAGLTRTLVAAAAEGHLVEADLAGLTEATRDAILADDVWRAARYSLDARLVTPAAASGWTPIRDAVSDLLDRVRGIAESLDEAGSLEGIARILDRGSAADRIRRVREEGADMHGVVRWLATETVAGVGMDRRREPRHLAWGGSTRLG
jgi:glutamate---cysteine ligase / carboxylate-amine ligase